MKSIVLLSLVCILARATVLATREECASTEGDPTCVTQHTNGKLMEFTMLYYDSIALMAFVNLNIAPYILEQKTATPSDVATKFDLTLRAASALMVTMGRQGVLHIVVDNEDSVDDIQYGLSGSAAIFLTEGEATTTNFVNSFKNQFWTPDDLIKAARPQAIDDKDVMSSHLEETDEAQRDNARAFMRHMNSQSYSCAEAFPKAIGMIEDERPLEMLDVGGGSAIYTIAAARANPKLTGMIYELASIKPITEEFIAEANMSEQIKVVPGDFFSEDPFPTADIVLFANILHDWPDETNVKLLTKAYECLRPGGRVIVSEVLLGDNLLESSPMSTSFNIAMLQWTKGRQYRGKELVRRMERIGFVDATASVLVDDYSLVVGYKK